MSKNIIAENLLSTLPLSLQNDKKIAALANLTAECLARRISEIDRLLIFANIDNLPESLLDILAYDFKVDWWDYNYTLEQKRQTLKDSFIVHKRLGTKSAVKTAISAIYPDTIVQEWWEYGGQPYWFRLIIEATDVIIDSTSHQRVLALVDFYKSLRSHLGGITYIIRPANAEAYSASAAAGSFMRFGVELKNYTQRTMSVKAGARSAGAFIRMEVNVNGME